MEKPLIPPITSIPPTTQAPNIDQAETIQYTSSQQLERTLFSASINRNLTLFCNTIRPLLLSHNVNLCNEIKALHWASYCGYIDLVKQLLDIGCDVGTYDSISGETPIFFAIKGGSFPNKRGMTPFITVAAESSQDDISTSLRILELFYLQGVSLEEQDDNGMTCLLHASRRGSLHIVQWLLSRGASLAHRDFTGNSAVHYACYSGNLETVRFIVCLFNVVSEGRPQFYGFKIYRKVRGGADSLGNMQVKAQPSFIRLNESMEAPRTVNRPNIFVTIAISLLLLGG